MVFHRVGDVAFERSLGSSKFTPLGVASMQTCPEQPGWETNMQIDGWGNHIHAFVACVAFRSHIHIFFCPVLHTMGL